VFESVSVIESAQLQLVVQLQLVAQLQLGVQFGELTVVGVQLAGVTAVRAVV
jgi:hypothetical protein